MGVNSVAAQTFKGSFFSIGSAVITIVSGFVRTVILARLLLPEHFGAVALAMFLGFLTLLLALLLRRLYPSQPQMVSALVALSCVEIVKAVNSTPDILLRKELAFRYLAILDVSSSLAMTVVAPAMAWAGFGFWSLVGEQAVSVVVRTAGLWVIRRPWPFSLHFDKDIARWYFRFGPFVFLSSSFTFLLDQFDDFWTGTALGATALGFYSRAYEFARYPRRVIGTPITRVFFPTYAKLQHDSSTISLGPNNQS